MTYTLKQCETKIHLETNILQSVRKFREVFKTKRKCDKLKLPVSLFTLVKGLSDQMRTAL